MLVAESLACAFQVHGRRTLSRGCSLRCYTVADRDHDPELSNALWGHSRGRCPTVRGPPHLTVSQKEGTAHRHVEGTTQHGYQKDIWCILHPKVACAREPQNVSDAQKCMEKYWSVIRV